MPPSGSARPTYPRLRNPGDTLDWQVLRLPEDDQVLMVLTAPPDTESLEVLRKLDSPDDL